ncbi:hypothetical protein N7G274_004555 [Stereocaulon virgatum]|uniref:Uncharacterized protein n=1 Tax=Stereocaulon virgatum TaxID=373712 RepID=A0ABR4AD49_9LECA
MYGYIYSNPPLGFMPQNIVRRQAGTLLPRVSPFSLNQPLVTHRHTQGSLPNYQPPPPHSPPNSPPLPQTVKKPSTKQSPHRALLTINPKPSQSLRTKKKKNVQ